MGESKVIQRKDFYTQTSEMWKTVYHGNLCIYNVILKAVTKMMKNAPQNTTDKMDFKIKFKQPTRMQKK